MLVPGYVTDSVGVLFFVPGLRTIIGAWMLHQLATNNRFKGFAYFNGQHGVTGQGGFSAHSPRPFHDADDVIEGDAIEQQPPRDRLSKS